VRPALALAALLTAASCLHASPLHAQDFRIEEVPAVASLDPSRIKPRTIAFSDHRTDELADAGTGLLRFQDWARARPAQKALLSLYPAYQEPTVTVSVNGITKPWLEKLHVYVAEARFAVDRAPGAIDLARYARLDFIERLDPSIKHRLIRPEDVLPHKDPELAYNRHPARRWCEAPGALCIESRYALEGKLPVGIRLANKLEEGGKKVADYLEFQSELRALPAAEAAAQGWDKLTGLATPVTGALEQNLFSVNQVIQFGKLVAVLQAHPGDPAKTVATVFMVLAVESDVLEKKKEYERVPVLRNLVPAQVLMGNSSFNTGTSISAGLPDYSRNRIKAIAGLLEKP
jgi:hypothetical protein